MRGTTNRRLIGAATGAVAVLICLTLSGCTSGPDDNVTAPTFAPAPSEQEPSATPSAEPNAPEPDPTGQAPAPPELPQAATQQTPEGAAAFASWWFDTLNYATATGDTGPLTSSSQLTTCESCTSYIDDIDNTYVEGGRFTGSSVAAQVEAPSAVDDRVATFQVRLEVGAGTRVTTDGQVTELNPESVVVVAATVWVEDRWLMGDLRQ